MMNIKKFKKKIRLQEGMYNFMNYIQNVLRKNYVTVDIVQPASEEDDADIQELEFQRYMYFWSL